MVKNKWFRNKQKFITILLGLVMLCSPVTAGATGYYGNLDAIKALESISIPEIIIDDLEIKAAYSETELFLWFRYESMEAGNNHDYLLFSAGEWRHQDREQDWQGKGGGNSFYEDSLGVLLDDGSVPEFSIAGAYATCHDGMPFLYNAAAPQDVQTHPVLGGELEQHTISKYLPATRQQPPFASVMYPPAEENATDGVGAALPSFTWSDLLPAAERESLHRDGYFLDFWFWQAHRSNPSGFADNFHITDRRIADSGRAPWSVNWDEGQQRPLWLFNPSLMGFYALQGDELRTDTAVDFPFLKEELAIPWSGDYTPGEGDLVPRYILHEPTGSRAAVKAESSWDGTRRTVILRRALNTGYPMEDKVLQAGETYTMAVSLHKDNNHARSHMITSQFELGLGVPADLTAMPLEEGQQQPYWELIPTTVIRMFYPGQVTWEFLISKEHAGYAGMYVDGTIGGVEVSQCHSPEELAGFAVREEYNLLNVALAVQEGAAPGQQKGSPGIGFFVLLALSGLSFGGFVAFTVYRYTVGRPPVD